MLGTTSMQRSADYRRLAVARCTFADRNVIPVGAALWP
jgi:hypothetical protein